MKRQTVLIACSILLSFQAIAQRSLWQSTVSEGLLSINQVVHDTLSGGTYVVATTTTSEGVPYTPLANFRDEIGNPIGYNFAFTGKGGKDILIFRLDENMQVEWATALGGAQDDVILDAKLSNNEELIVGGYVSATPGINESFTYVDGNASTKSVFMTTGNPGDPVHRDAFLLILDHNGSEKHNAVYGGAGDDFITQVAFNGSDQLACLGVFERDNASFGTTGWAITGTPGQSDYFLLLTKTSGETEDLAIWGTEDDDYTFQAAHRNPTGLTFTDNAWFASFYWNGTDCEFEHDASGAQIAYSLLGNAAETKIGVVRFDDFATIQWTAPLFAGYNGQPGETAITGLGLAGAGTDVYLTATANTFTYGDPAATSHDAPSADDPFILKIDGTTGSEQAVAWIDSGNATTDSAATVAEIFINQDGLVEVSGPYKERIYLAPGMEDAEPKGMDSYAAIFDTGLAPVSLWTSQLTQNERMLGVSGYNHPGRVMCGLRATDELIDPSEENANVFPYLMTESVLIGNELLWSPAVEEGLVSIRKLIRDNTNDVVYGLASVETTAGVAYTPMMNLVNNEGDDVSFDNSFIGRGGKDILVFEMDKDHHVNWAVSIGGELDDEGLDLERRNNGEIGICGYLTSNSDPAQEVIVTDKSNDVFALSLATVSSPAVGIQKDAFYVILDLNGDYLLADVAGGEGDDMALNIKRGGTRWGILGSFDPAGAAFGGQTWMNAGVGGQSDFFLWTLTNLGATDWLAVWGSEGDDYSSDRPWQKTLGLDYSSQQWLASTYWTGSNCRFYETGASERPALALSTSSPNENLQMCALSGTGVFNWTTSVFTGSGTGISGTTVEGLHLVSTYQNIYLTGTTDQLRYGEESAPLQTAISMDDPFLIHASTIDGSQQDIRWIDTGNPLEEGAARVTELRRASNDAIQLVGSFTNRIELDQFRQENPVDQDLFFTQVDCQLNPLVLWTSGFEGNEIAFGLSDGPTASRGFYISGVRSTDALTTVFEESLGVEPFLFYKSDLKASCLGDLSSSAPIASDTLVCAGSVVTLDLPDYTGCIQWKESGSGSSWHDIADATLNSVEVTVTETQSFKVEMRSPECAGKFTSGEVTVTAVADIVAEVSTPVAASNSICDGENATLEVLTYTGDLQWQQSTVPGVWNPIPGETLSTLSYPLTEDTEFRVIATSCSGDIATSASTLVSLDTGPSCAGATLWEPSADDGLLSIRKVLRDEVGDWTYVLASVETTAGVPYNPLENFEDGLGNPIGSSTTFIGNGGRDILLIKLENDHSFLWAVSIGGELDDDGFDLARGNGGRIGICGSITSNSDPLQQIIVQDNQIFDTSFSPVSVSGGAGVHTDALVIWFNGNGQYWWHRTEGGEGNDMAMNIRHNGSSWGIQGHYEPNDAIIGGIAMSNSGSSDQSEYFLWTMNNAGSTAWLASWGTGGDDYVAARPWRKPLGLDFSNGAWFTSFYWLGTSCRFYDNNGDEFPEMEMNASEEHLNLGLAAFDTDGQGLWSKALYTGSGTGAAGNNLTGLHLIARDYDLYFTGTTDQIRYGDEGATVQPAVSMDDPFIIKASWLNGEQEDIQWINSGSPTAENAASITGINLNADGAIQVAGYYSDNIAYGGMEVNSSVNKDIFFSQLDCQMNPLMIWTSGWTGNEAAFGLASGPTATAGFYMGGIRTDLAGTTDVEADPGVEPFLYYDPTLVAPCINPPNTVTPTASNNEVCQGDFFTLEVATYTGCLQWQAAIFPGSWTDIPGATSPTLTIPGLITADYRIVATSPECGGISTSGTVTVTVTPGFPAYSDTPVADNTTVCEGQDVNLEIADYFGDLQWQYRTATGDWMDIPGATAPTLTYTILENTEFRVSATASTCTGTTYSNPIMISVIVPGPAASACPMGPLDRSAPPCSTGYILEDFTGFLVPDPCISAPVESDPPVGTALLPATYTITIFYDDPIYGYESCSFDINVTGTDIATLSMNDKVEEAGPGCLVTLADLSSSANITDPCGRSWTLQHAPTDPFMPGDDLAIGSYNLNIQATASDGTVLLAPFVLTIQDTTSPIISYFGVGETLVMDADCNVSVPDLSSIPGLSISDACPVTITQSPPEGSVIPGALMSSITLTADDGVNPTVSVNIPVGIGDDTGPAFTAIPGDELTLTAAVGNCKVDKPDMDALLAPTDCSLPVSHTVTYLNLGSGTLVSDSETSLDLGEYDTTVEFLDAEGNPSTYIFKINVIEDTPPIVWLDLAVIDITCTWTVEDFLTSGVVGASDACTDVFTVSQYPAIGSSHTGPAYPAPPYWINVSDEQGNVTYFEFTAGLNLTGGTPAISGLPGEYTQGTTAGCTAPVPDLEGEYIAAICGDISEWVHVQSPPAGTPVLDGAVVTVYMQHTTTLAISNTLTTSITVIDVDPPVLNCPPGPVDVVLSPDCFWNPLDIDVSAWASDNCTSVANLAYDYTIDELSLQPQSVTSFEVKVIDEALNSTTCIVDVNLLDVDAPDVTCPDSLVQYVSAGALDFSMPDVTGLLGVVDCNFLGDISQSIPFLTVLTDTIDGQSLTLTATDASGNSASCNFPFFLRDTIAPTLPVFPDVDLDLDADCFTGLPDYISGLGVIPDFSEPVTLVQDPIPGTSIEVSTLVTITATDAVGNQTTETFTAFPEDNLDPVFDCAASIPVDLNAGCLWDPQDIDFAALVSDNCTSFNDLTLGFSIDINVEQDPSVTSFTMTAQDESGNVSGCTVNVIPTDVDAPVVVCPGPQTWNAPSGDINWFYPDLSALTGISDCSGYTFSQSPSAGTAYSNEASGIYTFTITDDNGLISTCSDTWELVDNIAPTIAPLSDVNISVDGGCTYTMPNYLSGLLITSDFSEPVTVTQIPAAGGVYTTAELVTITATDAAGNSGIQTFTVTPVDNQDPVLNCVANTVVNLDADCLWDPQDLDFASMMSDNCTPQPSLGVSFTIDVNSLQDASVTSFDMTVTDEAENSSTCTITVVPTDVEPPVVTCPGDQVFFAPSDGTDFFFPDLEPLVGVTDCSGTTYSQDIAIGTSYTDEASGTYTITITDDGGLVSTCTANWTLIDDVDPVISPMPDVDVSVGADCQFQLADYLPSVVVGPDFSEPVTLVQVPSAGAILSDPTEVTITATDGAGNSSQVTFWVNPVDDSDPVLNCVANAVVNLDADCLWDPQDLDFASMMSDNCTPQPSLGVSFTIDVNSLQDASVTSFDMTVTDEAGNSSTCTITVVPTDVEPPVVTCPGDQVFFAPSDGTDFFFPDLEPLVGVTDCSGTTYSQDIAIGTSYTDEASGTYTITITDDGGLVSTCTANWTLIDDVDPVISPMPDVDVSVGADCQFQLADYLPSVVVGPDFSEPVTLVQVPSAGAILSDPTEVTITATDGAGNSSQVTFWVNPVDDSDPVLNCVANAVVNLDADCLWDPQDLDFASMMSDNCTPQPSLGVSFTIDVNSLQDASVTSFDMTVTDEAGNSSTCTITVVPTDVEPPVVTCPGDQVFIAPSDGTDFFFPDLEPLVGVTDCSGTTYSQDIAIGTSYTDEASGTYTITITDDGGLVSTCTANWTLIDDVDPTFADFSDQDIPVDGDCEVAIPDYISTLVADPDFSEPVTFVQDPLPGTIITGPAFITITATDGAGNSTSDSFTLTPIDTMAPTVDCASPIILDLDADCNWDPSEIDFLSRLDDNCTAAADLDLTFSIDVNTLQPESLDSLVITATDASLNSFSCVVDVITFDNILPVITGPDTLVFIAPNDGSDFSFPDIEPLYSVDECGGHAFAQSISIGTIYDAIVTEQTINVSAMDSDGNIAVFPVVWSLVDDVAPVIDPVSDAIVPSTDGCDAVLADYTAGLGAIENFSDPVDFVQTPPAGTIFTGSQVVTITGTDQAGNSAEITFTITATDQEDPTIDCSSVLDIVVDENCQWHVDDLDIIALLGDNCDAPEDLALTYSINESVPQPIVQDWFNLEAMDAAGNSFACDVLLNIIDDVAPVLTCTDTLVYIAPNDPVLNTFSFPDLGGEYTVVECNPHPGNALDQGIVAGTEYSDPVYEENFEITALDAAGNASTCQVVWSLLDVDPPVEVFLPDTALDVSGGCIVSMPNFLDDFVAEDYFSGIASVEQFPPAGQLVSATGMVDIVITDNAGNQTTTSFEAYIADEVAPTITCPSETETIYLTGLLCYHELGDVRDGILIEDNCDNNPDIVQTWPVDTLLYPSPDPHVVTFEGLDANGNVSTCTKSYLVENIAAPILDCGNDLTLYTSQVGCELDLSLLGLESDLEILNDCGWDYTSTYAPSAPVITVGNVVAVNYTVTRTDNGAFNFCSRTINLQDDEAPEVLENPAPVTLTADNDCAFTIPDYTGLVYTDCSDVTVSQEPEAGLYTGMISDDFTISVSFTDSNDLTTVVEVEVGVEADLDSVEFPDLIEPVGDECSAVMPDVLGGDPALFDACGVFIGNVIQLPEAGSVQNPGEIVTVNIVLEDDPISAPLYSFEVNFNDGINPVIECDPGIQNQSFILAEDVCEMIVPLQVPVSSDNCTLVIDGFDSGDDPTVPRSHGTYTALYKAEDVSGNTDECEVTYTIEDVTPPTIVCDSPEASCNPVIEFELPEFSDACGISGELIQTTNLEYGPGSTFPDGITELTYKIYDIHGNVDSCTTTVEFNQAVVDYEMPFAGLCDIDDPVQLESNQEGSTWAGDISEDGWIDPQAFGTGDFEVTLTIDNEGCIAEETYTFSIVETPSATFILEEEYLCLEAAAIELEYSTSSTSGTWNWSDNIGADGVLNPADLGTGTHSIVLTGVNGVCEVQYVETIEVVEDLGVNWVLLPEAMCITSGEILMDVDVPEYVNYSFNDMIDADGFFNPDAAGAGTHIIELTAEGASCIETSTQTVTVGLEALVSAGADQTLCGDEWMLNGVSDPAEVDYQWESNVEVSFEDPTNPESVIVTSVYGEVTLQLIVTTPEGCVTTDEVIIDFHEAPTDVDAGPDQVLVDGMTNTTLDGQYDGPGSILWTSPDENVNIQSQVNLNTSVNGLVIGENWIILTASNGVCAPVSDSLLIVVEEELIVPTGYSPNNDGENDYFVIDGSFQTVGLQVFNRWGNVVYETDNYENNWDGRDMQERPLPEDTYFYILDLDGSSRQGFVIIKRQP